MAYLLAILVLFRGCFFIIIELDILQTLILAIFMLLMGSIIKDKVRILDKFCIPSPVVGGLLFCILNLLLKFFNICTITMNTSLMSFFISFFFTIVGLSFSFSLIKKGGKDLFKYWILCGILSFCQNLLAVVLAKFTGIHPLLGLMCGTISMEGGHGYAASFGFTIESLGISNASSVGIASATFGLIFAGLLGGPVGKFLIEKNNLKYNNINTSLIKTYTKNISLTRSTSTLNYTSFLEQILVVFLCINIGELISNIIYTSTNILIPAISVCIFIAVIFRNSNDKFKILNLDFNILNLLSDISLGIFLTMALMSIDLFKLSSLFGPIIIIVVSQAIFIVLFAVLVVYKVLGKNLDAAVMVSGLIGHGLGATPNALANMSSVCQIYGESKKAFLIVPLVAAFLLDVFTMPCILFFINIFS